jgi:hypothetical protein
MRIVPNRVAFGFRKTACPHTNPQPLMSALGHKRTLRRARAMSALPPKADITRRQQTHAPQQNGSLCDHPAGAPRCQGGERSDADDVTLLIVD